MNKKSFLNRTVKSEIDFGYGDIVEYGFKPRYLTNSVLQRLEDLANNQAGKASETIEQLGHELASAVVYMDFKSGEGEDGEQLLINPDQSVEERAKAILEILDTTSISAVLKKIRDDIENPTGSTSKPQSSGSLEKVQ